MTHTGTFDQTAWSALEVGLPVEDIEPMRKFYCEGLGFRPAGHVDLPAAHMEALRFGDCLLKLAFFRDEKRRPKPRQPDQATFYITLRVAALENALNRCLTVGGNVIVPVTSAQTADLRSIRFALVADPMGNRIELVEGNAWSD